MNIYKEMRLDDIYKERLQNHIEILRSVLCFVGFGSGLRFFNQLMFLFGESSGYGAS